MDHDLASITEKILASYRAGAGMNNIDGSNLPSKRALATICEDLLQLLFPGFHDAEPIHSRDLRRVTSHRIYSIAERLGAQATLAKPFSHTLLFETIERVLNETGSR